MDLRVQEWIFGFRNGSSGSGMDLRVQEWIFGFRNGSSDSGMDLRVQEWIGGAVRRISGAGLRLPLRFFLPENGMGLGYKGVQCYIVYRKS